MNRPPSFHLVGVQPAESDIVKLSRDILRQLPGLDASIARALAGATLERRNQGHVDSVLQLEDWIAGFLGRSTTALALQARGVARSYLWVVERRARREEYRTRQAYRETERQGGAWLEVARFQELELGLRWRSAKLVEAMAELEVLDDELLPQYRVRNDRTGEVHDGEDWTPQPCAGCNWTDQADQPAERARLQAMSDDGTIFYCHHGMALDERSYYVPEVNSSGHPTAHPCVGWMRAAGVTLEQVHQTVITDALSAQVDSRGDVAVRKVGDDDTTHSLDPQADALAMLDAFDDLLQQLHKVPEPVAVTGGGLLQLAVAPDPRTLANATAKIAELRESYAEHTPASLELELRDLGRLLGLDDVMPAALVDGVAELEAAGGTVGDA